MGSRIRITAKNTGMIRLTNNFWDYVLSDPHLNDGTLEDFDLFDPG